MENKFTLKAQNVLSLSLKEAENFGHTYIGSEHLLLGLLSERECVASKFLSKRGISYNKIKSDIILQSEGGAKTTLSYKSLTPRVKKIVESASKLSQKHNGILIGSEHLLYALLSEGDCPATRILEQNGLLIYELQSDILSFIHDSRSSTRADGGKSGRDEKPYILDLYGRNLIDLARNGKIDPTLCREKETERVIQILSRRTKNNPCLIGEPGVGKTAVIEGLASRIAAGNVPPTLRNKIIYSLDVPSMIAGAKYRGEFEDRMKNVMAECSQNKSIILFIDEIHTIIGAGSAEGAIDAANIIKPALSRGELQIIGATTIAEYRKHIERDSALERRFQSVMVNEPTQKQAIDILLGLRERYERHHKIKISDEAIISAVELSEKYINDRFLPDKAIDLIDEAASKIKIEGFRFANNLEGLENEQKILSQRKENAINEGDFVLAQSIRAKELELAKKIDRANPIDLVDEVYVMGEDIAKVVTEWTGIPASKLLLGESASLLTLEDDLKAKIVGQDEAIRLISQAIRRGRIGLKQANQPLGSFIFIGPSGVGKTELCLSLAKLLFNSKNALIRLDMSEFMEKHSISKLIGAPPGYVGYGEGGGLTERVRRNPYCVILFDEIEKAHPDIFGIMLQILEDGVLTDSQGRHVSFKNALIIMTSNLGSSNGRTKPLGFSSAIDKKTISNEREKSIKDALSTTFKPEFLNRVDEIVIFNSLTQSDIEKICKLMFDSLSNRLIPLGIEIEIERGVTEYLARISYDEKYGARQLRREIRRLIENPLSNKILEGKITNGDRVSISLHDDQIILDNEKATV